VGVNYHTLSDFRVENGEFLEQLLVDTVASLIDQGLVPLETIAQDGMRVRVSAGSSSFRRKPTLEKLQQQAQTHVDRLKEENESESQRQDADSRRQAATERAARERQERIDEALKQHEKLSEQRENRKKGVDRQVDEESLALPRTGSVPSEEIPQTIGRYEILKHLGQGAFADVYLAHDPQLDRQVALKVPRKGRFDSEELLNLFVQEARNSAHLDHPGIVRVHDVQSEWDGVYIVQQYIAGTDLAAHVRVNALSTRRKAELLIAVGNAVGYAHKRGCWHRDLKPANLLIDADGRPFVADFGLAIHESNQHHRAGELAGTPAYMSPEQVRREVHVSMAAAISGAWE
jgi:serine/threonine protein kinase